MILIAILRFHMNKSYIYQIWVSDKAYGTVEINFGKYYSHNYRKILQLGVSSANTLKMNFI